MNWWLYGTWNLKRTKNLLGIRHTIQPSLSFSYSPDFGKDRWGYYRTVQSNASGAEQVYSIFTGTLYGGPGRGLQANVGFSVRNTLQIKVRSKRDTITGVKKINIFDNFSLGGSYNIAGDSLSASMSTINFTGNNSKIFENKFFRANLNFGGTLDPLYINPETNARTNDWRFGVTKRFFRLTNFNFSIGGSFTSKKRVSEGTSRGGILPSGRSNSTRNEVSTPTVLIERDPVYGQTLGYIDFDIPWSFQFTYSFNLRQFYSNGKDTTAISSNNIRISRLDFNLTPKWKINVNGIGYDFIRKEFNSFTIGVLRDLHCWQMGFNVTPIGTRRQFSFTINVRSQILKDLRYSKEKNWFDF